MKNSNVGNSAIGYAISSVDSTPLFYRVLGKQKDHHTDAITLPIILCDGIGCDGFIWKYLIPQLAKERQVLHWHYRGHGRSALPKRTNAVSIETLADDLASVMDDAGIEEAVIAGHSMGVQVALEFHRRHRFRTGGLLLVCGAHSHPLQTFKGSDFLEKALPAAQKAVSKTPKVFRSFGKHFLTQDWVYRLASQFEFEKQYLSQQDFMPYLQGLSHMDPAIFLAILAEAAKHSSEDMLSAIRVPVQIIAGELDTFTPSYLSQEMAAKIPGAKLSIVKNGTHTAPLEHHELVGKVVSEFLSQPSLEESKA